MVGAGIALLSSWYTAEYLQSGRLVAIALEDAQPKELAVWAVYPARRQVLSKVRVFVEAMRGGGVR
ncbi:LysR substrate-binding domain-containing protein [Comamonas sp.]|uniref:LysR substrate-binding domain-containing protein n=1 Tax=Comamonas sp. TaxID=34028 RepID=UPI003D0BC254